MKNKSLLLLLVAAGCGLVAMLGVQQMLSGGKSTPKTRILVARTDIEAGVELDKTNVGFKEWPADAIPEGAVQTEEQFAERALKHRAIPGQPILITELGEKGEFGLHMQIPTSMRVVTVPVTATMTHSGLLRPGNFVDVSAVIETNVKGGGKRVEVKPVLQCIQVFAVGSQIVGSEGSKDPKAADVKNVSFLVYPLQAQLMQLANKQSNGGLQFALRSSSDKNLVNARDLNDQSLTMLSNSLMGQKDESVRPIETKTDEKPEPKAVVKTKPKSAFRDYLAPETAEAMTSVGKQAVRRTWKIEIFQGDQREVKEIDWPEESSAETKRTTGDPAKPWSNPLLKLFHRSPKAEPNAPLETQSTSLVRRTETLPPPTDETAPEQEQADSDTP
jgi:pilus assembly protein CpaB